MSLIPNGISLLWFGDKAALPSGWVRDTAFDGKFIKGWSDSEAPNLTGGSNTHTHSSSHSHTLNHHTHTFATGYGNENPYQQCSNNDEGNVSAHTHSNRVIDATSGGGLQTASVPWSSVDHQPAYRDVIFITPQSTFGLMLDGIGAFYAGGSLPNGFSLCDGNNGTLDYRNKHIKGAAADSNGGVAAGSNTHVHTISHSHTVSPHSHTGYMNGIANWYGGRGYVSNPSGAFCHKNHTHIVYLSSVTDTINSYTNTTAGGDDVQPLHKKIAVIKNTAGKINAQVGLIGLWKGNPEDVPVGWEVCDGSNGTPDLRGYFIKGSNDLSIYNADTNPAGEIGKVAGSNTHTHSPVSHTHTAVGTHSHTGSHGVASMQSNPGGTNDGVCYYDHIHAINSISSSTSQYSSDNITPDTVDNQPAYRTAVLVRMKFAIGNSLPIAITML